MLRKWAIVAFIATVASFIIGVTIRNYGLVTFAAIAFTFTLIWTQFEKQRRKLLQNMVQKEHENRNTRHELSSLTAAKKTSLLHKGPVYASSSSHHKFHTLHKLHKFHTNMPEPQFSVKRHGPQQAILQQLTIANAVPGPNIETRESRIGRAQRLRQEIVDVLPSQADADLRSEMYKLAPLKAGPNMQRVSPEELQKLNTTPAPFFQRV